jgi:hypothetical protein
LTDHPVAQMFQRPNYPVCRYTARQVHAASTGINSYFT